MSKRPGWIVPLVGVGVVLLAVFIVLSSVLAPIVTAKRTYRDRCRALEEATSFAYLAIVDPLDHSGPLLPTDSETRLTDADEILSLRDRLLPILKGARYAGHEDATGGNWDIRIRFAASGETVDFYLREDAVYLTRGNVRWLFVPENMAAYTALRDELCADLPEAAS